MGRIILAIIFGGCLVAGASYAVKAHNEQMADLQVEAGRQTLRADFDERIGAVTETSNSDRHREELLALVKWYDSALADLYNNFPGVHDPDAMKKALDAQAAAGEMKPEELELRKEWYDETNRLYEDLEHGRYDPMVTAIGEGVRFDILGIKRATVQGKSRLRMDVVLWGAPRREIATKIEQGVKSHVKEELDLALQGLDLEFVDANQKLLAGGSTGAPTMTVEYPERWVPDFPPEAALAIWYLDPFPADTKTIDLKMNGEVRSPTAPPESVALEWKIVPQPDWLIRPGEKFEGEERVMSKEELDRSGQVHAEK